MLAARLKARGSNPIEMSVCAALGYGSNNLNKTLRHIGMLTNWSHSQRLQWVDIFLHINHIGMSRTPSPGRSPTRASQWFIACPYEVFSGKTVLMPFVTIMGSFDHRPSASFRARPAYLNGCYFCFINTTNLVQTTRLMTIYVHICVFHGC